MQIEIKIAEDGSEKLEAVKKYHLDLSLISGALLAIWERVRMNVFPEGYIVLGGEPAFCPLYAPSRKLWKIVKEGNAIAFELNSCEKVERLHRAYTQEER